jgi:hypothetical protein
MIHNSTAGDRSQLEINSTGVMMIETSSPADHTYLALFQTKLLWTV